VEVFFLQQVLQLLVISKELSHFEPKKAAPMVFDVSEQGAKQ
jgi:hypothetical protein